MITPSFLPTATERVLPKLALDFTTATLDSRVTFTRALNTATRINSSGSIETVNADLPRFDYDPTTLVCKGLLIEESRTNGIRNNTMIGAVAGAPGTMPTNWSRSASPSNGISIEIVGTGTESGITYADFRLTGTATANFGFIINAETSSGVAASPSQTWTNSVYLKVQSGSLSNANVYLLISEYDSSSVFLRNTFSSAVAFSAGALITQRKSASATTGALTAYVQPSYFFSFVNGSTYDVTFRLGLPQLELGAFATSVIITGSGAVTRNADVATMTGTNFSDWYNASEGTFAAQIASGLSPSGTIVSADFGSASRITYQLLSGNLAYFVRAAGATSALLSPAAYTQNTVAKIAGAYKVDNYAAAANASAVLTDTAGVLPPTPTQLTIGSYIGNNSFLSGHVQKIMYWPQRLVNAEVQAFSK